MQNDDKEAKRNENHVINETKPYWYRISMIWRPQVMCKLPFLPRDLLPYLTYLTLRLGYIVNKMPELQGEQGAVWG